VTASGWCKPRERRGVPPADLGLPVKDRLGDRPGVALWVIDRVRVGVLADVAHQRQARNGSVKRRDGSGEDNSDCGDAYRNLDQPAKAAERHDQELEVCPSAHDEALTFWLLGRETPTLKRNLQPVAATLRAAGFAWQLLQVAAEQRIEDPPFAAAVVLDDPGVT